MFAQGKPRGVVIAAIARELVGFVWAIAMELEKMKAPLAA
jgi:hypothetical protein